MNKALSKTIVVIEDDADSRELYSTILQEEGFKVKTCEDAEMALQYLKTHPRPDLLLMDLNFPRMSAGEFISKIRKLDHLQNVKIIVLSGDSDIEKISVELGIDSFIRKPCDLDQFVDRVKEKI